MSIMMVKKIFDYYSDRNFTDFKGVYSPELPNTQSNSTTDKDLLSKQGIDEVSLAYHKRQRWIAKSVLSRHKG